MSISCPVCNSTDNRIIRSYRGSSNVFRSLQLTMCNTCSMVFTNPMPSEWDLTSFNASYFKNAHGGKSNTKVADSFFNGIAKLRYQFVKNYLENIKKDVKIVLEIGPGPGYFATHWVNKHPDTNYIAVESDSSCYPSLQKVGIKIISDMDELQENYVDLVVISHVLEHVTNPAAFLSFATSKLKKGGVLFIEVPCQDWKHKPLDEPHLLFFEKKSMQLLLEKLAFKGIYLAYFGKKLSQLKKPSILNSFFNRVQNKMIYSGLIWPFSGKKVGMEGLDVPLERASMAQYKAHAQSDEPAWWLRAISLKS
jgi:ubiquinone/menaquinone biosynthesis C-methylase UbiE